MTSVSLRAHERVRLQNLATPGPPEEERAGNKIDHCRLPDNRPIVAYIENRFLKVNLYDDQIPEQVSSTLQLAGSVVSVSVTRRGDAQLDLIYTTYSKVVRYQKSRNSGVDWEMPITLTSGYDNSTHASDDTSIILMLWKDDAWYVRVLTLDDAGNLVISPERFVVAGLAPGGSLIVRSDTHKEFTYFDLAGVLKMTTCKNLRSSGVGNWS